MKQTQSNVEMSSSSSSSDDVEVQVVDESLEEGQSNGKKYYCQRCLNHNLYCNRKGHKPNCKYLNCNCDLCKMVEERRQLNNMLSLRRLPPIDETAVVGFEGGSDFEDKENGKTKKLRDPMCSRCRAHGLRNPLRGHKKSLCPFSNCTCTRCGLVENRRVLMAKQIRLRRGQQRMRDELTGKAAGAKPKRKAIARTNISTPDSSTSPVSDTSKLANTRVSSVDSDGVSRQSSDSDDSAMASPSLVQPTPIMPMPIYPVMQQAQLPPMPVMPAITSQQQAHNIQLLNFYMNQTSPLLQFSPAPLVLSSPLQQLHAAQEQLQQLQTAQLLRSFLFPPTQLYQ